jgi:aspartyl-tRNA(Asn)/glutamyl-tRNA(Gln) amidotransferase subunit C
MHITLQDIQRVAFLARLHLTPEEQTALIEHFNTMLSYVEKLHELQTEDIHPTAHAVDVPSPLRDDVVTNHPNTDALLQNAPARSATFFCVPKIIEP